MFLLHHGVFITKHRNYLIHGTFIVQTKEEKMPLNRKSFNSIRSVCIFFTLKMIKKTIEMHSIQRHSNQESITISPPMCGMWMDQMEIDMWCGRSDQFGRTICENFDWNFELCFGDLRIVSLVICIESDVSVSMVMSMSLLRLQNCNSWCTQSKYKSYQPKGCFGCSVYNNEFLKPSNTLTHSSKWQWFEVYMKESRKKCEFFCHVLNLWKCV